MRLRTFTYSYLLLVVKGKEGISSGAYFSPWIEGN